MGKKLLTLTKDVASGTNDVISYTPDNNEVIYINKFGGQAPESSKADVRLVWDNGTTEEDLWSIQVAGDMPHNVFFKKTGDGTSKIVLCLANGCADSYVMSGYMLVEGEDV